MRLRDLREIRGLTQSELAERVGMEPAMISHFEIGSRKPSYDNLRRLALGLECSVDQIMGITTTSGLTAATQDTLSDLTFDELRLVKDFAAMLIARRAN